MLNVDGPSGNEERKREKKKKQEEEERDMNHKIQESKMKMLERQLSS